MGYMRDTGDVVRPMGTMTEESWWHMASLESDMKVMLTKGHALAGGTVVPAKTSLFMVVDVRGFLDRSESPKKDESRLKQQLNGRYAAELILAADEDRLQLYNPANARHYRLYR